MSEWVPIIVAVVALVGVLGTEFVRWRNARRADERAEAEGENEADDKRIGRIFEGFEGLLDRNKEALGDCENQLKTCTENASHLGDTVVELQDRVREATLLMDAHLTHLREQDDDV